MILFDRILFQNRNFSLRKELSPRGSEFNPLRAAPYVRKITFNIFGDLPWMLLFLLRTCKLYILGQNIVFTDGIGDY